MSPIPISALAWPMGRPAASNAVNACCAYSNAFCLSPASAVAGGNLRQDRGLSGAVAQGSANRQGLVSLRPAPWPGCLMLA